MLDVAVNGPVRRLTLNRPERRNALTPELTAAIHAAVVAADGDPDCRVLVIGGANGHFCAGRDLSGEMAAEDLATVMAKDRQWADILRILDRSHVVSVATVEGYAVAGGFTLAMGCDFVLATEGARFGAAEMRNGFPAAVNTPVLTHLVGRRLALELLMFGDLIDAGRLYEMGLINRLAMDGAALANLTEDWVGRLLTLDPEAMTLTKESHRLARHTPLADALSSGAQQNALLAASGAFRAGAERFKARQAGRDAGEA